KRVVGPGTLVFRTPPPPLQFLEILFEELMAWFHEQAEAIPRKRVEELCQRLLDEARSRLKVDFKRVLLLPPDLTRAHSGAGWITETLYKQLPKSCDTHVIPTLGQHVPHDRATNQWMFGSI